MKRLLSNDWLTLVFRMAFGAIFIYAAIDKIQHPDQFARIIYNYHLVPGPLVNLMALVLPMSELLAGICVVAGVLYRGARNYLLLMLAVFMVAITVNIIRGIDLECGCFTVSTRAKSAGLQVLIRDVVFAVPGLALLASRSRRWMIENVRLRS